MPLMIKPLEPVYAAGFTENLESAISDNRCTMLRATPPKTDKYKRDVRRTTISEYGLAISWADAREVMSA